MNKITELKKRIIDSGYKAVEELIKVAEEKIVTHMDDDLSADKLKNAAAAKKLAIMDAFEILKRVEEENNIIEGVVAERNTTNKGFAEKFATKKK
jgi:hypothetical protein